MDLTSASSAVRSLRRRDASEEEIAAGNALLEVLESPENSQIPLDLLEKLIKASKWECRATGLLVGGALLGKANSREGSSSELNAQDENLVILLQDAAQANIEDREPRVRTTVVKALEALAQRDGSGTWARFGAVLCDIVDKNFDLDESERASTQAELAVQNAASVPMLVHETIGWKALETSMRGLEALIRGYGKSFVQDGHTDDRDGFLLSLVSDRALVHQNRYVREVGYDLCGVMVEAILAGNGGYSDNQIDAMVSAIARGLSDNWSQVRYAASVAARKLMLGLLVDQRQKYLDLLVPRMCLNRYYLAMGVRLYSQETWQLTFGDNGVAAVCGHMGPVVQFYCEQSAADNHGVREAACHSIAELSSKIPHDVLSPYVDILLKALLDCFRDDSWPVRDAACVSSGDFVLGYPEECRPRIEEFFTLWFNHLSDNIWSVREDAAVALGNAARAYPEEGIARIMEKLPALLERVHDEVPPAEAHDHDHDHDNESDACSVTSSPPEAPSSPRVMAGAESRPVSIVSGSLADLRKDLRSADPQHSDQQLFSCGSLAPKLKRRGVGCMDHGYSRPKRAWEDTDGAIYLVRELAGVKPELVDASIMDAVLRALGAPQATRELRVTILKQMVPISQSLGKRTFKRCLEELLPMVIQNLSSENQLVAAAAADLIMHLMRFLGPNVFRGRVEMLLNGHNMWQDIERSPLVAL
mmetsp:Transcript_21650/g.42521  ORF Transcript_21650/g.42521 Transcript_21650/m.42521 type:complete len:703 (-) Transcript_21650:103-2211(-)|eukprot:CAMPEP_0171544992 /NCGR_PEP_ID=MMETSP0960-20121227/3820_1 /TAXON_ID=87120 /ORGANISM="Aurantiochytrium limacinum, Strain ATCCMYA-1381" /LENGTH=702 /DNA_ID=CAMNT_0012092885 /DNA_START=83 /DNA_END=2191 /DNA_ORIENTATION=-